MDESTRYYNFPISFLEGFMIKNNQAEIVTNIIRYAVYDYSFKKNPEFPEDEFLYSASYLGVSFRDDTIAFENGKSLFEENQCKVTVGINTSIYWDYYKNEKTEFEDITLLAFLGIKSIVQNHVSAKITNQFLFSRMAGFSVKVEQENLPFEINYWFTEYRIKKIKTELETNWNLKLYGRYMRGYCVSFKLSLDELVLRAETKRESNKVKRLQQQKKEALAKAKARLNI